MTLPSSRHDAVVDTGASRSCVSAKVAAKYPACQCQVKGSTLRLGDDSRVDINATLVIQFTLGTTQGTHEFLVLPNLPVPFLIGMDMLSRHALMVHTVSKRLVPARGDVLLACDLATPAPSDLTPAQQQQLESLLAEYEHLFSTDENPFGRTHLTEHSIETGSAKPIHQGLRPTSPTERAVVQEEVRKMLETGAIRPSTSPWASPTVMVTKKDGSIRFCIDFKKLNDVTKKDVFPLPRISDLLESLASARFFTLLDAASGYWQIPVAERDIEKTAFITTDGLFEFLVMPFGLCNAPATYQRLMNRLLGGLTWKSCHVYIDDILVFSPTFEAHLRDIKEVFDRLQSAKMLLKRKKCGFAQTKTKYLGNVVSAEGISPDPAKVDKLRNFPAPTDKKEVRAFLGLAGYYRRFCGGIVCH